MTELKGSGSAAAFTARVAYVRRECAGPDWDAYGGTPALDGPCADAAVALAEELNRRGVAWPYVYPTNEGGMSLEWDAGPWAIDVDVNPGEHVTGDATNVVTGAGFDFEVPLAEAVVATLAMLRATEIEIDGTPQE
jgi:hypothetical protein